MRCSLWSLGRTYDSNNRFPYRSVAKVLASSLSDLILASAIRLEWVGEERVDSVLLEHVMYADPIVAGGFQYGSRLSAVDCYVFDEFLDASACVLES